MGKKLGKRDRLENRILKNARRKYNRFNDAAYYETQANLGTDYTDDPNNTVSTDEVEKAARQLQGYTTNNAPLTRRDAKRLYKQNFGSTAGFQEAVRKAKQDVLINGSLGKRIYNQIGEAGEHNGFHTRYISGRKGTRNDAFYLASGEMNRLLNEQIGLNRALDYANESIDKSIESALDRDIAESNNELYKDANNWNPSYSEPAISTSDVPVAGISRSGKTWFFYPKTSGYHKDGDEWTFIHGRPSNNNETLSDGRPKYFNGFILEDNGLSTEYCYNAKNWNNGGNLANEVWLQRIPKQQ